MQNIYQLLGCNKVFFSLSAREVSVGMEGFVAIAIGICPMILLIKFFL